MGPVSGSNLGHLDKFGTRRSTSCLLLFFSHMDLRCCVLGSAGQTVSARRGAARLADADRTRNAAIVAGLVLVLTGLVDLLLAGDFDFYRAPILR
jgi:hypothetical protein